MGGEPYKFTNLELVMWAPLAVSLDPFGDAHEHFPRKIGSSISIHSWPECPMVHQIRETGGLVAQDTLGRDQSHEGVDEFCSSLSTVVVFGCSTL